MRTWLTAVFVGLGSLLFFLSWLSYPPETIFDEAQYTDAARALLTGARDPSPYGPPLGKLLVACSMRLLGDNPLGWRMASAVFGAVTLVGVFLFTKLLLNDYALALTAVVITLLNNFLYVFSRTAMVDIFLFGFALWGILTFAAALKIEPFGAYKRRGLLALSGVLLGLACACKWNGVDELCVLAIICAALLFLSGKSKNQEIIACNAHLRGAGTGWLVVSFLGLPVLAYLATFWPLCRMLHLPFSASQLVQMNVFIWHFHRTVAGNPTLITRWYKWPLQIEPTRALSYLVGNWYVMWAGLVAWLFCLGRFSRCLPETLVVLLYSVNLLQWAATPQSCTFYYYYFPAAMFLGMAIPVALHRLPVRVHGVRLSVVIVLPAICVFAYCFGRMANLPAPYDCMLGCWP